MELSCCGSEPDRFWHMHRGYHAMYYVQCRLVYIGGTKRRLQEHCGRERILILSDTKLICHSAGERSDVVIAWERDGHLLRRWSVHVAASVSMMG